MDIEHLTKSQTVLLTLLVSFVTSIATGIVTVSLMEQAPPAVTQTVNRIVERTVEKVVPDEGQVAGAAEVVTETVVIRESELIARAVAAAEPSIVRLTTPGKDEAGNDTEIFVGIALVTNEQGEFIADAATPEGPLTALRSDGVKVAVSVVSRPVGATFIRLQASSPGGTSEPLTWRPARFVSSMPAIGQQVVAVGGRSTTRVGGGIIIGTSQSEGTDTEGTVIETDIAAGSFVPGSPLISADGVVGVATRATRANISGFLAYSSIVLDNTSPEQGDSAENQ